MKLISVDLEDPLPEVRPAGPGELWALVRLHGQPLGLLNLEICRPSTTSDLGQLIVERFSGPILEHIVEDGLTCPDLSSIAEALDSLPKRCPQNEASRTWPLVTVAVCTRSRHDQLAECLLALDRLEYPADCLEILVVENAATTDATKGVVARHPRVRHVSEPRPGLNWARNRAVLEARGDIIAFTDDDVSVDAGWVRAIVAAFQDEPHAMCVTGLVVPDELDTHAQLLFEKYGGFGRGFTRVYAAADDRTSAASQHGGTGRFGTGANMAFRRSVFATVGGFDPALDVGTVTNGGGDLEMFFRIIKTGHLLVYEPKAIVRHRHRREYAQLRRQLTDHGIGFYAYLVRSALAYREERAAFVRLGLWWFWYWHARRVIAALTWRKRFPLGLIFAELRGSLIGLRRYSIARRHAATIEAEYGPQPSIAGAGS
jgi:GT2 family glycosyltransferase